MDYRFCAQPKCGRLVGGRTPLFCHAHSKPNDRLPRCNACGCVVGEGYMEKHMVDGAYLIGYSQQKWNPNGKVRVMNLQVCGGCDVKHGKQGRLLLARGYREYD